MHTLFFLDENVRRPDMSESWRRPLKPPNQQTFQPKSHWRGGSKTTLPVRNRKKISSFSEKMCDARRRTFSPFSWGHHALWWIEGEG